MNAIRTLLTNLQHIFGCTRELFRYALTFLRAMLYPKAVYEQMLKMTDEQVAAASSFTEPPVP